MEWIIGSIYFIALLLLVWINLDNNQHNNLGDKVFYTFITFVLLIGIIGSSLFIGDKYGQKQALRGKFKYKMEIKYGLKDSVYTSVDTVFVEIKK